MSRPILYILDVFAEKKLAGNQLAVFRHAQNLSEQQMQEVAREMHFSETTYIVSEEQDRGGYPVRIFTPEDELPFAGHPTLGTAFVIQQEIIGKPVEKVILNLKVGQIPVTFSYKDGAPDVLWMKQKPPSFEGTLDKKSLAVALSIEESDIDENFPVEIVSTGFPTRIVPLKSLSAVKKASINKPVYMKLVKEQNAHGVLIFCRETYHKENDLNVRFFADELGVPEDPATGSANGCLAGYLVKNRYFGSDKIDIRVEQGYEMNRPSLLLHKAHDEGDHIEVNIGGRVFPVARGELLDL